MNPIDTIITHSGKLNVGDALLGERLICKVTGLERAKVRECHEFLYVKGIISKQAGCVKRIIKDVYTGEDHY